MSKTPRPIKIDAPHAEEVLNVLAQDIGNDGTKKALVKAKRILELAVDPTMGKPAQASDGLLYGLIQSGKTSILTLTAGLAVDNDFDCILVLTTDNDPLYDQTKDRIRAALGGLTVLGKKDWKDPVRFANQIKAKPFAIVCSKNGSMLTSLVNAFKAAKAKALSLLIVDDEADQASLDTKTSKPTGQVSPINREISAIRSYFPVNTYLQVTATPQALFLQRPNHLYRPSFTVLTEPGPDYVGGDAFFSTGSKLLELVDINETTQLTASNQPSPTGGLPPGLKKAVCTFFVGATSKIIKNPSQGYAFLLHVSMGNKDHEYTRQLLGDFKQESAAALKKKTGSAYTALIKNLQAAHADLKTTDPNLQPFDTILPKIEFYLNGANIKLINALSSDEIKLDSKFNLFVGGNKLGRGVTIKNLLVSYYGRNPKRPNADTVLQHARMYGYRKKDLGVTRLFLPQRLADHFRTIHEMESSLRNLLQSFPDGAFEGLYISGSWNPTRRNVLDPSSLGQFLAGGSVNPSYPLRTPESATDTRWLDAKLKGIGDTPAYTTISCDQAMELLKHTHADSNGQIQLWDMSALKSALDVLKVKQGPDGKPVYGDKVYFVVKRNRDLKTVRSERDGIISGGEDKLAPTDAPTLFLYRMNKNGKEEEVWWPQLRFPKGNFVLSFAFDW
jgi:Z1 domain-containing protein